MTPVSLPVLPAPSALKAIRAKCIDCSSGELVRVRKCPQTSCALYYPFRMGKIPESFRSEAQRAASRAALVKVNQNRQQPEKSAQARPDFLDRSSGGTSGTPLPLPRLLAKVLGWAGRAPEVG